MIVASAENWAIGKDNALPWRLSGDLKKFKELTMGHSIIMGRKTFESIGRPLPGRDNFVLTRDLSNKKKQDSLFFFKNFNEVEKALIEKGETEAFIIGGGEIYKKFLGKADRIYLTRVHTVIDGDTFFPELKKEDWELESDEKFFKDNKNEYDWSFQIFNRKG